MKNVSTCYVSNNHISFNNVDLETQGIIKNAYRRAVVDRVTKDSHDHNTPFGVSRLTCQVVKNLFSMREDTIIDNISFIAA